MLDELRRWRSLAHVLFEETPTFTKRVIALITDESYAQLQEHLIQNPDAGDLIRNSGGFRKIRWAAKGRGKSGASGLSTIGGTRMTSFRWF